MAFIKKVRVLQEKIQLKRRVQNFGNLLGNSKARFLSIFTKKYETPKMDLPLSIVLPKQGNLQQLKLQQLKRRKRNFFIVLSGFFIIFMVGNFIYIARAYALDTLDPSLLDLIIWEMQKQARKREFINQRINFQQKIGSAASIGISAIPPFIPKRYKKLARLPYAVNILINAYMLFIDLYRK